jgi:general secretion pathway protein D
MKSSILMLSVAALVAGCAQTSQRMQIPPARVAGTPDSNTVQSQSSPPEEGEQGPVEDIGPTENPQYSQGVTRVPSAPRTALKLQSQDWSGRFPANDSLAVAVEAMPLKDFVNYSFSEALKASYVLAPGVQGLDDPVTLNLEKPVSSRAYYKLVTEMLASRGISTTYRDGVFYLASAGAGNKGNVAIGFGRRPQDVPEVAGKIMQVVPLRYGLNPSIERTIVSLADAQVAQDTQQGALFITGERDAVLRALDVVTLLDQPASRAREVGIIDLNFVTAKAVSDQLALILGNEGIPTGVGGGELRSVAIVPLDQLGSLVVFASSPELLQRVDYWVKQLDKPNQGPEERYFIYHPRYARASDLGESVAPLLGGTIAAGGDLTRDTRSALMPEGTTRGNMIQPSANSTMSGTGANVPGYAVTNENVLRRDAGSRSVASEAVSVKGEGVTLSVDPRSNTLIFFTTGAKYQTLLPMVQRLDVPPKQILLETMIAEVTLTGEFAYGVEFAFTSGGNFSGGTLGGLGLPSGGLQLNWFNSLTQQARLKLSASNNLVNILSNPTLVVRDGVEATITVGNDVPTVGATATDPLQSDTQITQVLYRKTGLDLKIRPTINAEGVVVMEINQSISNTVEGASDVQGAPVFFERAVSTEVVARSGESILLAGLISERKNDNSSYVPGLGQIPGIGWLFRSDSKDKERTELVVLITPRVIEDPKEWNEIRIGMQGALQNLVLPEPNASGYGRGGFTTPALPQSPSTTEPPAIPPGPGSN